MVEAPIRLQRPQEGLLERVVGALAAEPAPEEPHHLDTVLLVEALERRNRRHGVHLGHETQAAADL